MNFMFWGFVFLFLFLIVFALQTLIALVFKDITIVTAGLAFLAGAGIMVGLLKHQSVYANVP